MTSIAVTIVTPEEKKTHSLDLKEPGVKAFAGSKYSTFSTEKCITIADNKSGKAVVTLDMKDRADIKLIFNSDNLKAKKPQKPAMDKVNEGSGVSKPKVKLPGEAKPKASASKTVVDIGE